jgi:Rhodopirellula transposase DDE domain
MRRNSSIIHVNRGCGDPTSPLRWTSKSTRHLADALGAQGFQVSDDTVGRLLRERGYRPELDHGGYPT